MKNFEYYGLRYGKSESLAHTAAKAILSFSLCRLHLCFYADGMRYPSGRCLCNAGLRYQQVQRHTGPLDQRNGKKHA